MTRSARWRLAGLVWLAVIGWVTLRSAPDQAARVALLRWNCVACGEAGVADLFLNVVLFVPLGLAARGLGMSLWRTLAVVVPLTVGIEVTQGLLLTGRDAALGDVLANSAGGLAGWLGYPLIALLGRPSRTVSWRASAVLFTLTTTLWFASGIGLKPSLSDQVPLTALTQPTAETRRFPVTINQIEVDGAELPGDPPTLAATRPGDSLEVAVELTRRAATLPAHSAPFLRIADAGRHPQVALSGHGSDLVAEAALRASHWLLHTPQWRFANALDIPLEQPVRLRLRWTHHNVSMQVGDSSGTTASARVSIALGWIFIHPFVSTIGDSARLWTFLWLAWWFGLSGWLAGGLGWRVSGAIATAHVGALLAAAAVTDTPWHGDELLAALAGYAVAVAIARQFQRRTPANPPAIS